MQKLIKMAGLILALTVGGNAYAWYCNFSNNQQGWYLEGSMYCEGISINEALQNHYCGWYRPSDPYCSIYQVPVCSSQVEYQTLTCPIHQSGAINQSRTFECSTQSWTAWTTTSNNCTPDPPTCIESSEARQVTCSAGYEGYVQEQRSSLCSDPYGSPIWTAWSTILDTCKMTATNINNPASPISPISPINPNSVISQSTSSTTMTQAIETAPELSLGATSLQESLNISPSPTTTTEKLQVSTSIELKPVQPEVRVETPKGKEIVPGFGIVLSMQILNAPYNMQQQQVQEYISLEQENEYGRTQEFTLSLLSETNVGDRFDSFNRNRWANLLRNNPLQRLAEYD